MCQHQSVFVRFWGWRNTATINIRKWQFLAMIIESVLVGPHEKDERKAKRGTAVPQWKGSSSGYSLSLHSSRNKNSVSQSSFKCLALQRSAQWLRAHIGPSHRVEQKHIVHRSLVSIFNPLSSSWETIYMFRRTNRNQVTESWLVSRLIYTSPKLKLHQLTKAHHLALFQCAAA